MKNCNKCNAQNTDDAKFCFQCGASFEDNIKEETVPQMNDAVPQTNETVPQTNETVPQTNETVPQTNEAVPQTSEVVPQPNEAVPQTSENDTVQSTGPKPEENTGVEKQGGSDYQFDTQFDTQIDLNGVSEAEFSAFVRKNQNDFIPAFRKFCSSKKVSFSPLVFLLSWLISPLAGAFWFFHRKMNKIGAIVLSISLALIAVGGIAATYMVSGITDATVEFIRENSNSSYSVSPYSRYDYGADADDFFDDYYDNYDDYDEYNNSNDLIGEEEYAKKIVEITKKYLPIMFLISIMNFALALILGLFAKYWYFEFSANSILAIKRNNPTPECMNDIAVAGGTKCTVWVICLVVCALALIVFALAMMGTVFNTILKI